MNKIYQVVWSQVLGAWVVVSELAGARTRRAPLRSAPLMASSLAMACAAVIGSAGAQNVTLSGDLGEAVSQGCVGLIPSTCAASVPQPNVRTMGAVNQANWVHRTGPYTGVLIGANLSNSNTGRAASASASVTGGGSANTGFLWVGFEGGTRGSLDISGAGSRWNTFGATAIGNQGTGTLAITDGGSLTTNLFYLGHGAIGNGSAVISGPGSRLDVTMASQWLIVGRDGRGSLLVQDQGLVNVAGYMRVGEYHNGYGSTQIRSGGQVNVQRFADITGDHATTSADVLVSGAGSAWTIADQLRIGRLGAGVLTIDDGGQVSVATSTTLAGGVSGRGTLNIGAAADALAATPGVLQVPSLVFGAGTGNLVFNHSSDGYRFDPVISGGQVGRSQINQLAGVTSLTADNSAFGGTTNVSGGTLRIDSVLGNAGSAVNVATGGVLTGIGILGGSVTVADGVLTPGNSGPGTLTINGGLSLGAGAQLNYELGAAETAGGALNDLLEVGGDLVLDGTLNVTQSAGGAYGAGIYRVINYAGSLTDNGLELGNMPAGTDNVVQTSIANQVNLVNRQGLLLNWWDGNAGGRNDGVVDGGDGEWTAALTGNTIDRWTQADALINAPYQNAAFAIFAGAPGTVTVTGADGQVQVSGMQFASDGYRIEGDSVELVEGSDAVRVGDGTGQGAATTTTIASELIGAGRLDKVDLGTLVLTADNSFTGGTAISEGTLQLGDGGSSGAVVGDIEDNGVLAFNRSDAFVLEGNISGNGSVEQIGSGSTTLAAGNAYRGGSTISAGTLIGEASSFGSGAIDNEAALVIDQAADASMANAINGSGSVSKTGTGVLEYTGSGTLTGPTAVQAGTWMMNGALPDSPFSVLSGATLAGTGTVGAAALESGAVIAPGNNGVGTLNVNGDYLQQAGSIYRVQVVPGGNVSDHIAVTGAATLASGAQLEVAQAGGGDFAVDTRYTVLTATGGVTGTYALSGQTSTAFVQLTDTYDANNVYLTANQVRELDDVEGSDNHEETGSGVDSLPEQNPVKDAVVLTPDLPLVRDFYDTLSGEIHASTKTVLVDNSRFARNMALDRLGAMACTAQGGSDDREETRQAEQDGSRGCMALGGDQRQVWGETFGSWGHVDSNGNAGAVDTGVTGVMLGADTSFDSNWRFGVLGGFSSTQVDGNDRGRADVDSWHLGAYGGSQWGGTSLRMGLGYARNSIQTRRIASGNGYADMLRGDYDGDTVQAYIELAHRFQFGNVGLEPFAQAARVQVDNDGFREQGGAAALEVRSDELTTTLSTLGVRADGPLGDSARWETMLGWRHASGDRLPHSPNRFVDGDVAFDITGVPLAKNVAVVDLGVDLLARPDFNLGFGYTGQFGDGVLDGGFRLGLTYRF